MATLIDAAIHLKWVYQIQRRSSGRRSSGASFSGTGFESTGISKLG